MQAGCLNWLSDRYVETGMTVMHGAITPIATFIYIDESRNKESNCAKSQNVQLKVLLVLFSQSKRLSNPNHHRQERIFEADRR